MNLNIPVHGGTANVPAAVEVLSGKLEHGSLDHLFDGLPETKIHITVPTVIELDMSDSEVEVGTLGLVFSATPELLEVLSSTDSGKWYTQYYRNPENNSTVEIPISNPKKIRIDIKQLSGLVIIDSVYFEPSDTLTTSSVSREVVRGPQGPKGDSVVASFSFDQRTGVLTITSNQ